jgi:DNA-binding CsgD family transcriptional regulator
MREGTELQAFSRFVGALHEARHDLDGPALLDWAAGELSGIVGFDAAWLGWADMTPPSVEIIGTTVHNLPADYVGFWNAIRSEDLLAADVKNMKTEGRLWAQYDRDGNRHTDGMIALADRYGLRKLSVVTRAQDPLRPQLFLSAYRGGVAARGLDLRELTFLSCALDHMQGVLDRASGGRAGDLRLLVDDRGRPVAGSAAALTLWSGWRGEPGGVSGSFDDYLDSRGFNVLANPTAMVGGHKLTELRLIPRSLLDSLSAREREVAELIAEGFTHKEIARSLGIAPTTVRNQTARIYEKAGVSSRAALTRAILTEQPAPREI